MRQASARERSWWAAVNICLIMIMAMSPLAIHGLRCLMEGWGK